MDAITEIASKITITKDYEQLCTSIIMNVRFDGKRKEFDSFGSDKKITSSVRHC